MQILLLTLFQCRLSCNIFRLLEWTWGCLEGNPSLFVLLLDRQMTKETVIPAMYKEPA
jgi:hypothetical protein